MKFVNYFSPFVIILFLLFGLIIGHDIGDNSVMLFDNVGIVDRVSHINEKLYTYDDIVGELQKVTEEFYEEFIRMRNMLPSAPPVFNDSDSMDPVRRRRSIDADNFFVPDFIRDGIQLISEIMPVEDEQERSKLICSNKGFIIDFVIIKFNYNQYILCLVKDAKIPNHKLYYGPIDQEDQTLSYELNLKLPKRIMAFVDTRASKEVLVVIFVNEKRTVDELSIKWIQINTKNEIIYQNYLSNLKRISSTNIAIWEQRNMIIVHDLYESVLKMFKFVDTYFDHVEFVLPVTNDLNVVCTFTLNGVSYLALGYREKHLPKDVSILRYNDYINRLEIIQSIQCSEKVIGIEYFIIGNGINQENFLAIVEENYVVLYKFLKPKREFLVFQRISSGPIRRVVTYGDIRRMFVMAIILKSNDIYFITYNSLRFIYSPINLRVYVNPMQPIYLKKILSLYQGSSSVSPSDTIQLMIGAMNGIRLYNIKFFHDNNLFELWREHLKWCHKKRTEIADLEKRTSIIENRFHESYFKSDPLIIPGTLSVPSYHGSVVETKDYRNTNNELMLNGEYFAELSDMKERLNLIEREIHKGHKQLSNAVFINSAQVQTITGNFSFKKLSIIKYDGNQNSSIQFPATMNLITEYLNGKMIRDLFTQVIDIRNHVELQIPNQIFFQTIDLTYLDNRLYINGLVNERFNLSNIVTSDATYEITGYKRFYQSLIVDNVIYTRLVNGKIFDQNNVLLTVGEQIIRNPIQVLSRKLRTGQLNVINVNNLDFVDFLSSVIQIDQQLPLMMPIKFANKLIVHDLGIGGKLNEENLAEIYHKALWLNKPDQKILGDCFFQSNMSILANLYVQRINNCNFPQDFILTNQFNTIVGQKNFYNQVYIQNLNVTQTLNGLLVISGIPDIVINYVEQNITGKKTFHNLSVLENSHISGLLNGMSLAELNQRSQYRPKMLHYDKIYIKNMAYFEGGVLFEYINSITDKQFLRLMQESLTLNDQWSNLAFDNIYFDDLHINNLDCDSINGIDLENDLLTRTTIQTINFAYKFRDIQLESSTRIDLLNDFTLTMLNNILRNVGNQIVNGTKEIIGDIYVESLQVDSINDVPLNDVIFNNKNNITSTIIKPITGFKHFNNSENSLYFDLITIDDLIVESINKVNVNYIINHSMRRLELQNISNEFRFNTLLISENEELLSPSVNGINLKWLNEDIVLAKTPKERRLQNVTAAKTFLGPVHFNTIEFRHLFDGVTVYEMKNNWLVNNDWSQPVRSNFSIDHLTVRNLYIHDSYLNEINLDWLVNDVVWLDKKTSILSQIEFYGDVKIMGNILLNGLLNEIDLRKDVVLNDNSGIQTIKGNIRFVNNVTIDKDLDVNGLINNISVNYLCTRIYKPIMKRNETLVINGNVDFWAPVQFHSINELPYKEMSSYALRHDLNDQQILGKKMIDTLVLNGPTILNSYMNDLNLEYIFEHYLSVSKDQEVEANIVLRNVRFEDDVDVEQIFSDSDIINGIDFNLISRNSLRQSGDQIYGGNIHFNSDVDIQLHLNAKWINGIGSNYLMNKKRMVNTFSDEIVFTQDLNVKNNMNVVKGKKISNVYIDRFLKNAVLQHSHRNYTIYGTKTFDKVDVYILHTRPLNNITFSRENLLLKRYDQIINGKTHLKGDLLVNTTLVINEINDINLNDLKRRIVKKNRKNVVRTKIRVKDLVARKVHVSSFIDNVNISILNQFSNTTNYLKNLDQELRDIRSEVDVLQRNLQIIGSKLLYFDRLHQVSSKDLNLTSFPKPLFVFNQNFWICLFLPFTNSNPWKQNICNQVNIYCNAGYSRNNIWTHSYTFYYPGILLAFELVDNVWLLSSKIQNIPNTQLNQCLQQNNVTTSNYANTTILTDSGLWFQSIHFLSQSGIFYQKYYPFERSQQKLDYPMNKMILILDRNPSYALIASENILSIIHIGHVNQIKIYSLKKRFELSGKIQLIHHWKGLLLISIYHQTSHEFELKIFSLNNFKLYQLYSISNVKPKHLVMSDNHQISDYQNFMIFTEVNSKIVHVFATTDGTQYTKIQEIHSGFVKNLAIISNHHEPNLLMVHLCEQINIYQLSGLEGFRILLEIKPEEQVNFVFNSQNLYLYLFYGTIFHQCGDETSLNNYLEIVVPRYRNKVYGNETKISIQKLSNETVANYSIT